MASVKLEHLVESLQRKREQSSLAVHDTVAQSDKRCCAAPPLNPEGSHRKLDDLAAGRDAIRPLLHRAKAQLARVARHPPFGCCCVRRFISGATGPLHQEERVAV